MELVNVGVGVVESSTVMIMVTVGLGDVNVSWSSEVDVSWSSEVDVSWSSEVDVSWSSEVDGVSTGGKGVIEVLVSLVLDGYKSSV
jgi:hypothetical protein